MQKECKNHKGKINSRVIQSDTIRPEPSVPDSDQALPKSGITGSGFDSVFAMIKVKSGVYESGVFLAHMKFDLYPGQKGNKNIYAA